MSNKLILEPQGGLANRMRVIASGLWLGRITGNLVTVVWTLNKGLNSPFEKLFEPIENCIITSRRLPFYFFRSEYKKPPIKKVLIRLINTLFAYNYIIIEDPGVILLQERRLDFSDFRENLKTPYFRTCEEFGDNTLEFNNFIPVPEIQQRIDLQCSRFTPKTIGLHIRRTDHEIAIRNSPVELFINRIKNDLEKDPDINYFLSTDDAETESQIRSLFGDKIMTIDKEYTRNSIKGIKDAVIDLFCLSRTSKIYGSYWSSFSDIASKIGKTKIEKIIINKNA